MKENFDKYINSRDVKKLSNRELALLYKYIGDNDKSRELFKDVANSWLFQSRFGTYGYTEEEYKNNFRILFDISKLQLNEGIYLFFAGMDTSIVRQHFGWAAENSYISEEEVPIYLEYNADDVAVAHLWRGYALLMLGNYEDACTLLRNVVPFFNKSSAGVYQTDEYYLPKALVPLCEYLLNHTEDNKLRAINGLENYINSYKMNALKLCAYLYYFHLKESFPDVYGVKNGDVKTKDVAVKIPVLAKGVPHDENNSKGDIVMLDLGNAGMESMGNKKEFDDYIDKVYHLGNYRAIIQLMETYMLGVEQEPGPLVRDCEDLLSRADLEPVVRRITEKILDAAEGAKIHSRNILLYYEKD